MEQKYLIINVDGNVYHMKVEHYTKEDKEEDGLTYHCYSYEGLAFTENRDGSIFIYPTVKLTFDDNYFDVSITDIDSNDFDEAFRKLKKKINKLITGEI